MNKRAFSKLLSDIRACTHCTARLPAGPRPVVKAKQTARIMIIGQAPGTKVHASGVPWDDASGNRLRDWLELDKETFYDEGQIAIVPMGFCFPGTNPKDGDSPPRPECAPLWHEKLRDGLDSVELTLLIGQYARKYYLGKQGKKTMTESGRCFTEYLPEYLPTPHPNWRTGMWQKKNPWFEEEIIPELRRRVHDLLVKG